MNVLNICTDEELDHGEEDGEVDGMYIILFTHSTYHLLLIIVFSWQLCQI